MSRGIRQFEPMEPDPPAQAGGRYPHPLPGELRSPFGPGGPSGFLKRQGWVIAAGFLLVTASVAGITFLLPPRFESSATFLVERPQNSGASEALALLERLGQVRNTETESTLLQGRRVVEPVVDSLDLHVAVETSDRRAEDPRPAELLPGFEAAASAEPEQYELAWADGALRVTGEEGGVVASGGPGELLAFGGVRFRVPPAADEAFPVTLRVVPFAAAVEGARGRISAAPAQREADIVSLTCDGSSPEDASELCRGVQRSYLALRSELQRAEASAAADFLGDQVERVRLQLNQAEDSLQRYQERNQAVALDERASQGVIQSAALQARRRELVAERTALSTLIDDMETGEDGLHKYRRLASFPTFLQNNDHIVSKLVESLVDLENRRTELAVRRTEQNPELAALNARIQDIEEQLLTIARSYRSALTAQIGSLEETIREQGRDLQVVPEQQVETARLQRRITVLEELFRYLQTRLQEAEVAEAVTLPNVRVVDRPSVPHEPVFPNVPLNLALGLLLGASTGLLGGFWREYTDQKVRDRHQVSAWGIPVLTMVPRMKKGTLAAVRAGTGPGLVRRGGDVGWKMEVAEEAFRTLAFEVESAGRRLFRDGLRSVAVTSATEGEGKTFCATSLATQAALMGRRTLLVDADLRARGVGRWFDIPASRSGLGDLIHGGAALEEAVTTVELGHGATLDVLPSGRESTTAARLVTPALRRLLEEAEARYDLVVLDTPPLNLLTDAGQVASAVDGVVLVVRSGMTERAALEMALERLERMGGEALGVVLNGVELPDYYTSYAGFRDEGA